MTAPAKSSDWTEGEFVTHNIHVVDTAESTFFNKTDVSSMSLQSIPDVVMDNEEKPQSDLMKEARLFYDYMQLVGMSGSEWTASRVNDFTAFVLQLLNFDAPDRVVCQNVEIPFPVGKHKEVTASIDVCVMNNVDVFLVVHDCRSTFLSDNPEPPMVAQAIAAFHQGNQRRIQNGQPVWIGRYVAAIIMYGTAPVFYRVSVTQAFMDALASNKYPPDQMLVHRFVPPVPNPESYKEQGMRSLENREIVLQCLEAFKGVLM
ncbi:hypothetical protein BKA70DRAFT_1325868 [Coprinopsis sp. MPI-PUGE-AT-0042]|nr:hypothetical protein BKA70DRAFT_1325868 [Coprinopsis sp. MPI-PUGE-AT-0042]